MSLFKDASLLIVPSAYKAGKIYAVKPTDGTGDLTWTRGSDACRTNADGLIQRVPWNLLQYSEDFSNAYWSKALGTITANATTAPDGTLTADLFTKTSAINTVSQLGSPTTVYTTTGAYTLSVYLKPNVGNIVLLRLDNAGNTANFTFNFTTKTFSNFGANVISSSFDELPNGWFRLIVTGNVTSTSWNLTPCLLYANPTNDSMYIWGAQLVEGTTAQTYLPTTDRLNFPRLSYMYGSCPAVLAEPQRTNLVLWSEDFTNAAWVKGAGVSVTANTTIAPDGNQTADTITFTGSNQLLPQVCLTVGTNVTTSVWLKGTAGETILVSGGGGADVIVTLTSSWQRISFNRASTTTTSVNISTFGGVTARVLQVWGFQAEIGSFSTTYIPTTSATATRIADSFSRNNIYTNGLISASGGTWFVELRGNVAYTRDSSLVGLFLGDTSAGQTNSFAISCPTGNDRLRIGKFFGGYNQLFQTTTSTVKIAIKWNGTTADVFVNGTKQVSATAFTATALEFLAHSTSGDVPKFIQQMALFPTPLSDTDCTTLTT